MYVLDNDTTTHLFSGKHETLNRRILAVADRDIWLPVIVVQEQLNGRLSYLNGLDSKSPRDSKKFPSAYANLTKTHELLSKFQVLPYTMDDEDLLQKWPKEVKLIGVNDRRIAAIAANKGFMVITCNIRHFEKIPDVRCADWTLNSSE